MEATASVFISSVLRVRPVHYLFKTVTLKQLLQQIPRNSLALLLLFCPSLHKSDVRDCLVKDVAKSIIEPIRKNSPRGRGINTLQSR